MKSLSASHIKQSIGAAFLLLASIGSQESYASVAFTAYNPPFLPGLDILLPQSGFVACLLGEPCVIPDAPWVGWQLSNLQVGQEASLTTSGPTAFYLGNSLNGKFDVSLTPAAIQSLNGTNELFANIANRSSILSTTNAGLATFEASSGNDYYLLLSGTILGGQTYHLQVSQVLPAAIPVPAAVWLFTSGLGLLSFARRNNKSLT